MRLPPLTLNGWLRYSLIRRALGNLPNVSSVLEIGAGGGALGARLASTYDYVGVELDAKSYRLARERLAERGEILLGDLTALGSRPSFDLVCAFEVLEHIEDDSAALREWRNQLRSRGWLLLSVPALSGRWGPWDDLVGHVRRYDAHTLGELLERSGFQPCEIQTYGFPLGNLLEWLRHAVARRRLKQRGNERFGTSASGRLFQPPDRLALLTRAASAPFRLLQQPLSAAGRGTGLVALARKRD